MGLVCIAKEEENIARTDRPSKEDGRCGEEDRAMGTERVVSDDEFALTPVERDAACCLRKRQRALRGWDLNTERDA